MNNDIGVLGLFHCNSEMIDITSGFSPLDIPNINGEKFALYYHNSKTLIEANKLDIVELSLSFRGFEIITISPIKDFIAPLGLLEKYNGSRAIEQFKLIDSTAIECYLIDGGTAGFYCDRDPKHVYINGVENKFDYNSNDKMLKINVLSGSKVTIKIKF